MKRAFIVGCARSGTTILQTFLAAHSQIASFPESDLFIHIQPRPSLRRLRIASRTFHLGARAFLRELRRDDIPVPRPVLMRHAARWSTNLLDRLASEQGKTAWVEKTPHHIKHIEVIERYVALPMFIHVLRDGRDVVASMLKAARAHRSWQGPNTLDQAIATRNEAIEITGRNHGKRNHILIRYEDLMTETQSELSRLCQWLGLEFETDMIANRERIAPTLVESSAPWKRGVLSPIDFAPGRTFEQVLSADQRAYVEARLVPVSIGEKTERFP
jgi:hypothetical protein